MFNKSNLKEWFNRYKYAELSAICATLISSQFSLFFDNLTTAYLVTLSEYFAFYSVILFINYKKIVQTNHILNKSTSRREIMLLMQNLVLEFGYPSVLDFFVVRPFCMYWMLVLSGNHLIGIVFGKIAADSFFYTCTIINYEWIKRR